MPSEEKREGYSEIIILEEGTVARTYFSPQEVSDYVSEEFIGQRVDKSLEIQAAEEQQKSMENVVKNVAKKVFSQDNHLEPFDQTNYEDNSFENTMEDNELESDDIHFLELQLEEFIEKENFNKAAEIRDEINRKKENGESQPPDM